LLPLAGYRSKTPEGREVPASIYFDLATWHLINTTYGHARVGEIRRMRPMYADGRMHARLLGILRHRLGHQLAARAEQAKIAVAEHGSARVDLGAVETRLAVAFDADQQNTALAANLERIVAAARETAHRAQISQAQVQAVYFTGGSTGLLPLVERIAAQFPQADAVHGNRFTSVVSGLALTAQRRFTSSDAIFGQCASQPAFGPPETGQLAGHAEGEQRAEAHRDQNGAVAVQAGAKRYEACQRHKADEQEQARHRPAACVQAAIQMVLESAHITRVARHVQLNTKHAAPGSARCQREQFGLCLNACRHGRVPCSAGLESPRFASQSPAAQQ
ncbi:MAG TPA: hypothetical protein VEN28_04300, partial [Burkholderiaceae bacterium]|nr:hypothetical protein [Burkholderiaceae bacterium]